MKTRTEVPYRAKAEKAALEWNSKYNPGHFVEVTLDNGSVKGTFTTSEAWALAGRTAVVMLDGISGAYALNRVKPRTE